jgi:hypothetical protein
LPRDLGDVIHHFLPQKEAREPASAAASSAQATEGSPRRPDRPAALPIVSLPIGERDIVRAAYAWNLAVEVARRGASATLLAPAEIPPSPLWPDAGRGPVGAEVVLSDARSFGDLNRAALDIAVNRAADSENGGVVFVSVPPPWFDDADAGRALMRWILLFAAAERRDLLETYSVVKRIGAAAGAARVGVTIHGVRRVRQAEIAFDQLADVARRYLAVSLASYGLLVDDLHVYRAIVARRPIGIEHPQSRAARALRDVAGLLLEDARLQAHA